MADRTAAFRKMVLGAARAEWERSRLDAAHTEDDLERSDVAKANLERLVLRRAAELVTMNGSAAAVQAAVAAVKMIPTKDAGPIDVENTVEIIEHPDTDAEEPIEIVPPQTNGHAPTSTH